MDKQHNLFRFFQQANQTIESEYERICASVSEDPGTAGDQGEENWKKLLELWLPPYFHIETKGRILFENGETSPQVDVIVLSPEYPQQLWGCKRYLSGGVVAAFECKTTLRKDHIHNLFQTSKIIKDQKRRSGTPWKDLQSGIYYGMLAHSHSWKAKKATPVENISGTLVIDDAAHLDHPRQMPDVICVADLGVWSATKLVFPKQPGVDIPRFDHNSVETGYIARAINKGEASIYTPVGAMIFNLLNYLAWDYPGLRSIVSYMRRINVEGSGGGTVRGWTWGVFSAQTLEDLARNGLSQGEYWNERSMLLT